MAKQFENTPRRSETVGHNARIGINKYGYINPDSRKVPPEYLIKITSYRNLSTVIGIIQDSVNIRVESTWEPLLPTNMLAFANKVSQAIKKVSLINRATSRRVWMGTSPLTISLTLRFEAVKDAYNEVVAPGLWLQAFALPSEPERSHQFDMQKFGDVFQNQGPIAAAKYGLEHLPLVYPPGPTPFAWEGILKKDVKYKDLSQTQILQELHGGDLIRIEIGKFFTLWNVIIRDVSALYDPKFDRNGNPISGKVDLIIESYEMMTTDTLFDAYTTVYSDKQLPVQEVSDVPISYATPDTMYA
jgi:hypothetical protein